MYDTKDADVVVDWWCCVGLLVCTRIWGFYSLLSCALGVGWGWVGREFMYCGRLSRALLSLFGLASLVGGLS